MPLTAQGLASAGSSTEEGGRAGPRAGWRGSARGRRWKAATNTKSQVMVYNLLLGDWGRGTVGGAGRGREEKGRRRGCRCTRRAGGPLSAALPASAVVPSPWRRGAPGGQTLPGPPSPQAQPGPARSGPVRGRWTGYLRAPSRLRSPHGQEENPFPGSASSPPRRRRCGDRSSSTAAPAAGPGAVGGNGEGPSGGEGTLFPSRKPHLPPAAGGLLLWEVGNRSRAAQKKICLKFLNPRRSLAYQPREVRYEMAPYQTYRLPKAFPMYYSLILFITRTQAGTASPQESSAERVFPRPRGAALV